MTPLRDVIRIRARFARSTNLERDGDTLALADYVPTARSLDLLRRVALACTDPARPRAWSVSGPYGSGKSSFALLLDGLFGASSSPARQTALELIESVDPALVELVIDAHRRMSTNERGVIRAFVTAGPEPVTDSVLRGLDRGARRYWPRGRKPACAHEVHNALAAANAGASVPWAEVVRLLRGMSEQAPVLLLLDEFGKNLDYLRRSSSDGELYVLQAIAEASSGPHGLPVYLMTMQHMSFDDYAATASLLQRREWAKVQGRFEDVLYLDSPEQTIRLMGRVFEPTSSEATTIRRILTAAGKGAVAARTLGLSDLIGDEATLARTYPLHPTVVAVLPDLCRRYGQNERTLFSFLSHDEPHAAGHFISSTDLPARGHLPVVRMADVFDYFVGSVSPTLGVSPESARWFEIHDRISQAIGLSDAETAALKTIGVLNLVAQGGALRASRSLLAYALGPADAMPDPTAVARLLGSLEQRGFITYRSFADEYRLWQGSDFDLDGRIAFARQQYETSSVAELIDKLLPLSPIVASRHSQERGIVRTFVRRVVETLDDTVANDGKGDGDTDGTLVYVLSRAAALKGRRPRDEKPVIAIESPQLVALRDPLVEAAAAQEVLTDPGEIDWVAKRELQERAGQAFASVLTALEELLQSAGTAFLLGPGGPERLPAARTVSELASIACDRRYRLAPALRNEMLARASLTSQAARARLDLLTAMVASPELPRLGIDGYGPERAMYEAILARSGIHGEAGDRWAFRAPSPRDSYWPAWHRIDELARGSVEGRLNVAAVASALRRPPLGLKSPLVPILLTAYLLAEPDQIAVYQDGTFQPRLTPDLLERLTKAPDRFELRYLSVEGNRLTALRALATEFDFVLRSSSRQRGAPVLSVVAPLLEIARQLPEHSLHSAELSPEAINVREALVSAREPDQLIFEELPLALGHSPIRANDRGRTAAFAAALHVALKELQQAYPKLLLRIADTISGGLALDRRNTLKVEAAVRARPLIGHVVEPRLRSLLFAMSSDTLDDDDWLEAVALAISGRPPRMWRAADVDRFTAHAGSLLGAFRRVEAMHFDGRANSPFGFIPRKVTVTAPDGTEVSRVVWLDEAELPLLRRIVAETRSKVAGARPFISDEALLAALAEQVLSADRENTVIEEKQVPTNMNEARGLSDVS